MTTPQTDPTQHPPTGDVVRFTRKFTKDELSTALCEYLLNHGIAIPTKGQIYLLGLEQNPLEKESVTLIIDAEKQK